MWSQVSIMARQTFNMSDISSSFPTTVSSSEKIFHTKLAVASVLFEDTEIGPTLSSSLKWIGYHAYPPWLFIYSDLKTIIMSSTAFAVLYKLGSTSYSG